jgi:phenylpropionate dioxygenase-like ring-hydroxylating dioxygenase large terminal subunit
MTTKEENALLTQTGPGTPGGDLLRRYWQPVALSSDIAERPIAIRVLSEDLVLFRDESGQPGLLGLYCPHRAVDLSYGRVENGGLRCLYHGWLFDRGGRCLEQPAEPEESRYKDEIRHKSYPCREAAGAIFAYMGPGAPPLFPAFHFLSAPEAHVHQTKLHHRCNYLQANEGNIDPAHLSYLHAFKKPLAEKGEQSLKVQRAIIGDIRPKIEIERTRFGIRIYAQRHAEPGKRLVRITNYVFPNLGFFAGEGGRSGPGGYSVHWHVPIDDASHWRYDFVYHAHTPLDKAHLRAKVAEEVGPGYLPVRTAENRFRQDRQEMRAKSFAGLGTYFPAHDLLAVQTPGAIHDRTREHLATTDIAVVNARRMMLNAMKALETGEDPPFLIRSANENVFNDIVVMAMELAEEESAQARCAELIRTGDYHRLTV